MGGTGLEHPSKPSGKTPIPQTGGAKSGALGDDTDPDLAKIVAAWPTLAASTRRKICALVRAQDDR